MKGKFTLVIGLILLLLVGFVIYNVFFAQTDNGPVSVQDPIVPGTNPTTLPVTEDKSFDVETFLRSPELTSDAYNKGMYFVGNTFPTGENQNADKPKYVITFDSNTGFFNVILLERPFAQSRQEAETYLKQATELAEKDLCVLQYTLSVPAYVDENASGIDYRFSFCPDTIPISG